MRFLYSALIVSTVAASAYAATCDTSATDLSTWKTIIQEKCNSECAATDYVCMLKCVAQEAENIASCSSCVQGVTGCFNDKCADACNPVHGTQFWNADFFKCGFAQCGDDVQSCFKNGTSTTTSSGPTALWVDLIPAAATSVGACQDTADQPLLTSEAAGCGLLCAFSSTPVTCIETCLENDTKFSATCRSCITNGASCFNAKCSTECVKGLSDPTCVTCGQTNCATEWNACMATQAP
jgi:hypothetical protein